MADATTERTRGPILVVGLPRSGTTWTAEVLAAAPGVTYVHEPDNLGLNALAVGLRRDRIEPPWIRPGEDNADYRRLWDLATTGRNPASAAEQALRATLRRAPAPRGARLAAMRGVARLLVLRRPTRSRVLVKSVACYLSAEWVAGAIGAEVIVVHRHPINLATAWRERGWESSEWSVAGPFAERFAGTPAWPAPATGVERTVWEACASQVLLLEAAARNPSWEVVNHEERCLDPEGSFRHLAGAVGLDWGPEVAQAIDGGRVERTGFETGRRPENEGGRWRARLTDDAEVEAVVDQIGRFREVSESVASWAAVP